MVDPELRMLAQDIAISRLATFLKAMCTTADLKKCWDEIVKPIDYGLSGENVVSLSGNAPLIEEASRLAVRLLADGVPTGVPLD